MAPLQGACGRGCTPVPQSSWGRGLFERSEFRSPSHRDWGAGTRRATPGRPWFWVLLPKQKDLGARGRNPAFPPSSCGAETPRTPPILCYHEAQRSLQQAARGLVSRFKTLSVVSLSGGIVLFCLYQLSHLDFQTVLLIRSLHDPFVARLGYIGNRLGDGLTLVLLCVGLWGIGYLRKKKVWQQAGIDGIVAHALASLATQILKHLIGRPRPRFTHQDAFEYGPSWQGGLDAFPSGHAAAAFAVATVLARYFPEWRGLWYGGAIFVGMARVARGSHFPTDVLGGAVLGFLIAYVWARALKEWRVNVVHALPQTLPLMIGGCALFWSTFTHPVSSGVASGLFWTGLLFFVSGIGARWIMAWQGSGNGHRTLLANIMIALGLAISTQAWWIVMVTFLACIAWWLKDQPKPMEPPKLLHEAWLTSALVITLVTLQALHGLVP